MSSPPDDTAGRLREFLETIGADLAETFGAAFDFWRPGNPWVPLGRDLETADPAAILPEIPGPGLSGALKTRRPAIAAGADGRARLGLPIEWRPGDMIMAVAAVPGDAPGPWELAGRLWLRQLGLRRELDRCRSDLETCADQIGNDFEEMTFLRRVTDQLQMADVTRGTWQLAQAVLPLLAPLVHAQMLALLPQGPGGAERDAAADAPLIRIGRQCFDVEVCRRLVRQYGDPSTGQPAIDNHVGRQDHAGQFPGVEQIVVTPVVKEQEVLAWLVAINRPAGYRPSSQDLACSTSRHEYGTVEAGLMKSVASMLATHARNVDLFHEKESLLVGIVRSMVSAIDAKDSYTRGHSERVAMVARRLAEQLGLDEAQCQRVYLTGLLHDIGKIGVQDAILHKPGKLTDEEREAIMHHPDQGWSILQELKQLYYELPGVLHHHEAFDGSGYPDHLVGESIPLPARIVAVADSFDAMTSDRPYRQGMALDRVLDILHGGSGTQWDPQVIDAFFQALADILSLIASYQPRLPAVRPRRTPPCPEPLQGSIARRAEG